MMLVGHLSKYYKLSYCTCKAVALPALPLCKAVNPEKQFGSYPRLRPRYPASQSSMNGGVLAKEGLLRSIVRKNEDSNPVIS